MEWPPQAAQAAGLQGGDKDAPKGPTTKAQDSAGQSSVRPVLTARTEGPALEEMATATCQPEASSAGSPAACLSMSLATFQNLRFHVQTWSPSLPAPHSGTSLCDSSARSEQLVRVWTNQSSHSPTSLPAWPSGSESVAPVPSDQGFSAVFVR